MKPTIIVHGGAHAIPAEDREAHREGCLAAVRAGWDALQRGGTAVDAVEAAVRVLEDDQTFNAGFGSELNSAGEVEMDSALMDGSDLGAGGVGALTGVRHPISVARRVLESESVLLVAHGAVQFAQEQNLEMCDPASMISGKQRCKWQRKQRSRGHDTVGCVALDPCGHLASGTSTGGTNQNAPGRIGDSPLIGCGLYADDMLGACALTGDGESITRVVLAKTLIDLLHDERHPDEAASEAMRVLAERVGGEGGAIVIDRSGRIGWAHNAANLSCAYFTIGMDAPAVWLHKDEEQAVASTRD
jgi:beta-aspartyl-peptidase (threonine type)